MPLPTIHPIYKSMNEALLIFGCPVVPFGASLVAGCASLLCFGDSATGTLASVVAAIAIIFAGAALHKIEPRAVDLLMIWMRLAREYDAGKPGTRR